jgi:hypothetical protein
VRLFARYLLFCLVLGVAIPVAAQHKLDFVIPACPTLSLHEQDQLAGQVLVYPNPASGKLSLEFGQPADASRADILIYNVLGKLVRQVEISSPAHTETLDIGELQPGLYILRIQWGKVLLNKKIIVEPPVGQGHIQ